MARISPKTIMLLALVSLVSIWACDSTEGPTSISSPEEATSISNPGSFTTAASRELNEMESEEYGCARSPGFYCQNQNGKNPNMTAEEFQMFAAQAAMLLATVEELNTPEEVAAAICDTSDQLFRHLATLALNLASPLLNETDPHANPDFPTVGDAFAHAVAVADGSIKVTREQRKEVKRMIEQINENVSINNGKECEQDEYEDEDTTEDPGNDTTENPNEDPGENPNDNTFPPTACNADDPGHPGKILICHKGKNTLSIAPSAWPAHEAHGDTCGACGES